MNRIPQTAIFSVAIFLGAFLLFLVQPMIAKCILPWFGGTPAVWTTCMLFFQLLLLAGYAYTFGIATRMKERGQCATHFALLGTSILLLVVFAVSLDAAILPGVRWKPADSSFPVPRILAMLTVCIGLPYLVLSATSPLIQTWFRSCCPGTSPYRLYMLSNVGSLLALFCYPFVVEPTFSLTAQARLWAVGYAVFAVCIGWCAALAWRAGGRTGTDGVAGVEHPEPAPGVQATRPGTARCIMWMSLSACSCMLLLATTNQMCQEVAVVPFLWIVPLSVYLLTFIICFDNEWWYVRGLYLVALVAVATLTCTSLQSGYDYGVAKQVAIFSTTLFVCCMVCHGELVRQKPDPRYLTTFYLMIALGGALGGALVTILAPLVFKAFWEFHLSMFLCCLLLFVSLAVDRNSWLRNEHTCRRVMILVTALLVGLVMYGCVIRCSWPHWKWGYRWLLAAAAIPVGGGLVLMSVHFERNRLLAGAVLVAGVIALGGYLGDNASKFGRSAVFVSRNFYGVLRVLEDDADDPTSHAYKLRHGGIMHGFQYVLESKRNLPTSYYTEESGIGKAITLHPRRQLGQPMKIGVVGLGVGTLASYGHKGDVVRFYEINPQVMTLARGYRGFFSYLNDCEGKVEIAFGDARVSMERELAEKKPQEFDVLAVDAFSSDSIPIHLLTREAVEIYFKHLKPDGVLALHISNRYLNLKPVCYRLADAVKRTAALIETDSADARGQSGSSWVLITDNEELLKQANSAGIVTTRDATLPLPPVWTDQYSNLFEALKSKKKKKK